MKKRTPRPCWPRDELALSSICAVNVVPNERTYDVVATEECGSKVYAGTNGEERLTVRDNQTRSCKDVRPDLVEVQEVREAEDAGMVTTGLFGKP